MHLGGEGPARDQGEEALARAAGRVEGVDGVVQGFPAGEAPPHAAGLDAESRAYAGGLLPGIVGAFHTWDEAFHRHLLAHVGVDAAASERVLGKVGAEAARATHRRARCANTLQLLERCGVFKDARVRAHFVQAGLLDRDRPY